VDSFEFAGVFIVVGGFGVLGIFVFRLVVLDLVYMNEF
jgi:hypothetical protein